ncbi:hypothetical protein D3C81_1321480 [compost metagenome]
MVKVAVILPSDGTSRAKTETCMPLNRAYTLTSLKFFATVKVRRVLPTVRTLLAQVP